MNDKPDIFVEKQNRRRLVLKKNDLRELLRCAGIQITDKAEIRPFLDSVLLSATPDNFDSERCGLVIEIREPSESHRIELVSKDTDK